MSTTSASRTCIYKIFSPGTTRSDRSSLTDTDTHFELEMDWTSHPY
ncbi:MAG: hypothetical protein ACXABV_15380 [Candidatus Thorarchaeota archaeon]